MNYGNLKTLVESYIHRSTSQIVANIPAWINSAMHKLERRHNWACMEDEDTGSLNSATDYITITTRYKNIKSFFIEYNDRWVELDRRNYRNLIRLFPDDDNSKSIPESYSVSRAKGKVLVRPYPDTTYNYEITYRRYTADLSADIDTNFWTDNHYEILLYGALLQGELFAEADKIKWRNMYDEMVNELTVAEKEEEIEGSYQNIEYEDVV